MQRRQDGAFAEMNRRHHDRLWRYLLLRRHVSVWRQEKTALPPHAEGGGGGRNRNCDLLLAYFALLLLSFEPRYLTRSTAIFPAAISSNSSGVNLSILTGCSFDIPGLPLERGGSTNEFA